MEPNPNRRAPRPQDGDWLAFEQLLTEITAVFTPSHPKALFEFLSDVIDEVPSVPQFTTQLETIDRIEDRSGPLIYAPSWTRPLGGKESIDDTGLTTLRPIDERDCVVALLPASVLILQRDQRLRAAINERWHVSMVLRARNLLTGVHASFMIAALFLTPLGADDATRFVNPRTDAPVEDIRDDAVRLARMRGGRKQHGFVTREVLDPESWNPDAYDPNLANEAKELRWFGDTVSLRELLQVLVPSGNAEPSPEDVPIKRIISGRDIARGGTLINAEPGPNPSKRKEPSPPQDTRRRRVLQLRSGDLVVRAISSPSDRRYIVAAAVSPSDLPCYADRSVFVLRPKAPLSDTDTRFLLAYLGSNAASRQLWRYQAPTLHLSATALQRLPVPVLDETLRVSFEDLARGQRELREWADEVDSVLADLFDRQTPAEARRALLDGGRSLRQRVEAGRILSDLGNTVRTRYPYPIAFRWRDTEVARSSDDYHRTVRSLSACYEITLCYVAQLCLAAARFHGAAMPPLEALREKLNSGSSGPTLGDWHAIVSHTVNSREFRGLPDGGELLEVRQFTSSDEPVRDAMAALTKWRNDDAHLRTLTNLQLKSAADDLHDHLLAVLRGAAFLVDIPLIKMHSMEWDSLRKSGVARVQRLAGDHASVPFTEVLTADPTLERGSLYAESTTGHLHLLRPFLVGTECTTCHRWSTFHPDGYRNATVYLKSLEDGHVIENDGISASLRAVGLLPAEA